MALTHVDDQGRARMVDVGGKPDTRRVAVARGRVVMRRETLALIRQNALAKGDALAVARIAGILAAKKTSDLVPLCHPLMLTHISVEFELAETEAQGVVEITATVETTGQTGVEMEALTATSVAALAIYDMGKAVDRAMRLTDIRLVEKHGGKSGDIVLE
jgi:cyclic pyranopterin phosphate synthase